MASYSVVSASHSGEILVPLVGLLTLDTLWTEKVNSLVLSAFLYTTSSCVLGHREIQALEVSCDYEKNGCKWIGTVGTLDKHKALCGYAKVPCPKECWCNDLLKKELDFHLRNECLNRDYSCEHCGMKDTYCVIHSHYSECEKKMVLCSNAPLCHVFIERGKVASHLRESCDYTEVYCKYASIGCEEKRLRMHMKQHEENSELHLTMALDKIVELNKFTLSPEKKQRSITFKLNGFSLKTGPHRFQPFFTSPSGYKINFFVYHNGEGTHLSLFFEVLHGPYDDALEWPLKANFTVELLNQLADCNHCVRNFKFDEDKDYCNPGGQGYGYDKFIPLSKLSCDEIENTHYLKDDVLYFRVTVDIIHQKPWLDHTHT